MSGEVIIIGFFIIIWWSLGTFGSIYFWSKYSDIKKEEFAEIFLAPILIGPIAAIINFMVVHDQEEKYRGNVIKRYYEYGNLEVPKGKETLIRQETIRPWLVRSQENEET